LLAFMPPHEGASNNTGKRKNLGKFGGNDSFRLHFVKKAKTPVWATDFAPCVQFMIGCWWILPACETTQSSRE